MPIKIQCAACETEFTAPDALLGKRVRCKSCGAAVPVVVEEQQQFEQEQFAPLPDVSDLERLDPRLLGTAPIHPSPYGGGQSPWQRTARPIWNEPEPEPQRRRRRSASAMQASPASQWMMGWGGTFAIFLILGGVALIPFVGLIIGVFATLLIPLALLGCLAGLVSGCWLLALSYAEDELIQCLFIPFYLFYFMFRYWEKTRLPGHIYCASLLPVLALLGISLPAFVVLGGALSLGALNARARNEAAREQRPDQSAAWQDFQQPADARQQIEERRQRTGAPADGSEVAVGEGFVVTPPAGFERTEGKLDTFVGTPSYRSSWQAPRGSPWRLLTVRVEKMFQPPGRRLPPHSTNVDPSLDGTVVRRNGQYVLPAAEVDEVEIDGLPFLRAKRQRTARGATQHILLLAGYDGDKLIEISCVSNEPFDSDVATQLEASAMSLRGNVDQATFEPIVRP